MDAQAVRAALQKGRSGAPTLRHPVKQAGAISLACGWRWRYGYLPSESNPADDPSRGVVRFRSLRKPTFSSEVGILTGQSEIFAVDFEYSDEIITLITLMMMGFPAGHRPAVQILVWLLGLTLVRLVELSLARTACNSFVGSLRVHFGVPGFGIGNTLQYSWCKRSQLFCLDLGLVSYKGYL